MRKNSLLLMLCILLVSAQAAELELSPLFNSCGVRCTTQDSFRECKVTYREKGTAEWLPAFEAVPDENHSCKYRTSIVDLKEDTVYEVRAELRSRRGGESAAGTFRTWSSNVPVARTVFLTPEMARKGIVIRDKGTPEGWIRYTARPGTLLDGTGKKNAVLLDKAEYVILENLTIRGGDQNAVCLDHCRYVRLINCDISNWGDPQNWKYDKSTGRMRNSSGHTLYNKNAVYLDGGFGQVIERCYIHDPLLSSNAWFYGHPDGPQGVAPRKPRSTVIRYSDICGSDLKWWNDGIAGNRNFDLDGGLNRDCDVCGNFIAFANDDATELDGGQQNVRFFRNHVENCFMGVSIQGCMTGPSYIFENRFVDLRNEFMTRSSAIKTADIWAGYYAASFFYNNTTDQSGAKLRLCRNFRIVARNNILEEVIAPMTSFAFLKTAWDHNLLKINSGRGNFTGSAGFTDPKRGIYTLKKDSPARNRGAVIPGLNGRASRDLGAPQELELPFRPFPLNVVGGRKVTFTVKRGRADPPQTVTVKADAPLSFTVRKSEDSDWYEVTPSQVRLKAGEKLTLTVKLRPEKMKTRINYRSVFFLRTPDGWSRPVSVAAVTDFKYPPLHRREGVRIFTPGPEFQKVSGGGVRFEDKSKVWAMPFELAEDGGVVIAVEARALEPVARHDSVCLGMDDEDPYYCPLPGARGGTISTTAYTSMRAREYKLKKGKHVLKAVPRESLDLKSITIVSDVRALEER